MDDTYSTDQVEGRFIGLGLKATVIMFSAYSHRSVTLRGVVKY